MQLILGHTQKRNNKMTLQQLHLHVEKMLKERPELADFEVFTPPNDMDSVAIGLGYPVAGHKEDVYIRWTEDDSETAQADYEAVIKEALPDAKPEHTSYPANVVIL